MALTISSYEILRTLYPLNLACTHPMFENPAYITATTPFRGQSRIFVIETLHKSAHEFSLMV